MTNALSTLSAPSAPKPLLVAISGPTCSGKTTLTTILSALFRAPTIHQDNFFRDKKNCPHITVSEPFQNGRMDIEVPNSDCWGSVDWGSVRAAVNTARMEEGHYAQDITREVEYAMSAQESMQMVSKFELVFSRSTIESRLDALNLSPRIVFVEGFLLPLEMESLGVDLLLWLRTSQESIRRRRFTRWEYIDAPGGGRYPGQSWKTEAYFEQVVLPESEGVEEVVGEMEKAGTKELVVRDGELGVHETVRWAVEEILRFVEGRML